MVCPARSADTLNGVLMGEGEKEKAASILVEIGPHPFEDAGREVEAMFRTRGPVCSTAEPWAPDFRMSCLRPW
jgi:hypothetical protein